MEKSHLALTVLLLAGIACNNADVAGLTTFQIQNFRVLSPSDCGATNEATPLITWTEVSGAGQYRLSLYRDAALTDPIETLFVDTTSARVTTPLADGQVVYAQVRTIVFNASTPVIKFRVVLVPDSFPEFELQIHDPDRAQGGYKIFNLLDVRPPIGEDRVPAMVVVNAWGEIVWWYVHPGISGTLSDARQLPNGNLMFIVRSPDAQGVAIAPAIEMTWDRRIVWRSRPGVQVHHEAGLGPDGDYLYLTWTFEEIDGTVFEGDGLEIVDRDTDQVVWSWNIFDHLRPEDLPVPEQTRQGLSGAGVDWSHANSAVWDEARSLIWVSIRHLDRIIGVDYPSGAIRVTIGQDGLGGDDYTRHQHAPEVQADGSILFFDNGNGRAVEESRVAIFDFDETTGFFDELFTWKDDPPFYDRALGDADRQPNGNILITSGVRHNLIEITPAGEKVWQLHVSGARMNISRTDQLDETLIPPGVLPFR